MPKTIVSPSRELKNAKYLAWSKQEAFKCSVLRMMHACANASYAWTLLPLSLLLTACAAPSTVPCSPPAATPSFVLTQPLPQQSYSLTASERIKSWQKSVTDMYRTSEP